MSITRVLCAVVGLALGATSSLSAQTLSSRDGQEPLHLTLITESDRVRVTTSGATLVWRLEVVNGQGQAVFDSGVVTGTEIDWPLVDAQGQAIESGLYRYTLTIGDSRAEPPRLQRGDLQIERARSLYQISPLSSESTGGITLTTTASGSPPASPSDLTSPSASFRRSLSAVSFAPQPLISGSGTTGTMTKWVDGPTGVVGDTNVTEQNGSVVVGNGTFKGNLQVFGGAQDDVFAGMGPNLITGPGFNFGYAGSSFGRSAGFFNVRPDASAVAPNPSLRFMTNNVERMIVTNTGNVGIGTNMPTSRLTVSGDLQVDGNVGIGLPPGGPRLWVNGALRVGGGIFGMETSGIDWVPLTSGQSNLGNGSHRWLTVYAYNGRFAADGSSPEVLVGADVSGGIVSTMTNHDLQLRAGGNSTKVIIKASGDVGIGTTMPARRLDVVGLFRAQNGSFGVEMKSAGEFVPLFDAVQVLGEPAHRWNTVFATNGMINTSDARLKQHVTTLADGLAIVTRLRPVSFEWKDAGDGRRHLGLLAQEVEPIVPAVIHRDPNPDIPLGLNYSELIPVVIKAIQEQQATIQTEQATIARLVGENAALVERIAALEHVIQHIKRQPE